MATLSDGHDPALLADLRERVARRGPLTFAAFMEHVLYAPDSGYYMVRAREPGREGDFFTSVSVGRCFGDLLAEHLAATWSRLGEPAPWDVVELGAGEGRLLADLAGRLREMKSRTIVREGLHWGAVEVSDVARKRLARRCASLHPPVEVHSAARLMELPQTGASAYVFANELVDALPVHLVIRQGQEWRELYVTAADSGPGFAWLSGKLSSPEVAQEVARIPAQRYPEGYRTEVRPAARLWLHEVARWMKSGVLLILDYGLSAGDFYDPGRTRGTLQCRHGHVRHDDPLIRAGRQDITAHVDFTALAAAAEECGFQVRCSESQEHFLIGLARARLLAWEAGGGEPAPGREKWLRQFQQLTHPGLMGRTFHIMELELLAASAASIT
ncbi:MAG TPA: SAM-dependent methyltransferase [Verrucomicrobiales bacterium]|nr:SAM-dependent methyltransferase [Verrucomicrobiales bacterium]